MLNKNIEYIFVEKRTLCFLGYFVSSVNVITFNLDQNDHIKQL